MNTWIDVDWMAKHGDECQLKEAVEAVDNHLDSRVVVCVCMYVCVCVFVCVCLAVCLGMLVLLIAPDRRGEARRGEGGEKEGSDRDTEGRSDERSSAV